MVRMAPMRALTAVRTGAGWMRQFGARQWHPGVAIGGITDGQPVVHDHEPDVSTWRRFTTWLIAVLPVDKPL